MNYRELAVLLPCHSLEDFPLYHVGQDAESLLASWTALWHPALMVAANSHPKWHRVDYPPDDLYEKLLLVPTISVGQLPSDFEQQAQQAGAFLIQGETDRQVILAKAMQPLNRATTTFDPELVADFLALGYAYLQVQVLTRQMRYSSNLDEVQFFNQLMSGAKLAAEGDVEGARGKLRACFDLLAEDRDHYYSVDAYLIDVTLTAEQTLGAALQRELAGKTPINLLITGSTAHAMRDREPVSHRDLLAALAEDRVGLLGGEYCEVRIPLLPCESVLSSLNTGQHSIQEAFKRRIEVFARRQFGLSPILPGVLEKLRFRGAIHATLDDGQFPLGSQMKIRWQGFDTGVVDAIAKPPMDASKPETFLTLAQKLGESMDSDHVATLCFAHWPGQTCLWYEDLKRCAQFTAALGRFITIEKYFADTYLPGHVDRFDANQYKSPYLKQDVARQRPDPISSIVKSWQELVWLESIDTLRFITQAITSRDESTADVAKRMDRLFGGDRSIDERVNSELTQKLQSFSQVLSRRSQASQSGYLVVNPFSFSRRIGLDVSQLPSLPDVEKPVVMVDQVANQKFAVVDLPPMGFVWLTGGAGSAKERGKDTPQLAEDARERVGTFLLRNEFLEAAINPLTGALQTLTDYQVRGNRLSQQLALRIPGRARPGDHWREPDELAAYSVMAADDVKVTVASAVLGEIDVRGRLLDFNGQSLAQFRQTWRLWRGARTLELDIELTPIAELTFNPWESYYACRFAWSDETAELFQAVNQIRQRVSKKRLDAPQYVEIATGGRRVTILTGGLPYHRRVGSRMLDSLLVVRGETARKFKLGIGVEVLSPATDAISFLAPATYVYESAACPPDPNHSWLFHIDGRSVIATHWSSISLEDDRVVGMRVRLLETSGRTARIRIASFRAITSARQVNFLHETLSELPTTEGKVVCDLAANEWIEVEARWA